MIEVVPMAEVKDVYALVDDFAGFLRLPSNQDIKEEFPGFVEAYTSSRAGEVARDSQRRCIPGTREQFIAFYNGIAVGLGHLALEGEDHIPETVHATVPNVSVLVCNPYRNQGVGGRIMEPIIQAANKRFGGQAWTTILPSNISSQKMVSRAGFERQREVDFDGQLHWLYTYTAGQTEL